MSERVYKIIIITLDMYKRARRMPCVIELMDRADAESFRKYELRAVAVVEDVLETPYGINL